MTSLPDQLSCERVVWDETRHAALLAASESGEPLDHMRSHVEAGYVTLYEVLGDSNLLGVLFARVEDLYDGSKELVILAVRGTSIGFAALASGLVKRLAVQAGYDSIRVHTTSKATARLMGRIGWTEVERVHRLKV